jgi:hypothetical protein
MKLSPNSTVSVDALVGAIVTNEHGAEFKCIGLAIMITNDNFLEPILHVMAYDEEGEETLEGTIGLQISSLKGWSIQLQPHNKNND